jgi:GMP synthase (glutamine-hydrolysing)
VKPILLVRNDPYETFGVAPGALARAGADVITANMPGGAGLPSLQDVGGVIVFGGTVNVDMVERHPYLAVVRDYAREAVDGGVPYLGICLGSQILARAFGERVVKAGVKEVGFEPLRPAPPAADDPLLSAYADGDLAFQWHEDTFGLPEGGTLLASGDGVPLQAFRLGDRAWGIQFHQEVDAVELAWWIDVAEAGSDLEATWGKSAETLRREARTHIRAHEERGRELFRRFAGVVRGKVG